MLPLSWLPLRSRYVSADSPEVAGTEPVSWFVPSFSWTSALGSEGGEPLSALPLRST